MPELQKYLDRVVRYINENKVETLILCGGYTQRESAPGVSEAKLMLDYLIARIPLQKRPVPILVERNSYTTLENIRNIKAWVSGTKLRVTIFCEATRALKVDMLTRYYLGRRVNIETVSWEEMPPVKQLIATIYEFLAMYLPPLAWYFHWRRISRAKRI